MSILKSTNGDTDTSVYSVVLDVNETDLEVPVLDLFKIRNTLVVKHGDETDTSVVSSDTVLDSDTVIVQDKEDSDTTINSFIGGTDTAVPFLVLYEATSEDDSDTKINSALAFCNTSDTAVALEEYVGELSDYTYHLSLPIESGDQLKALMADSNFIGFNGDLESPYIKLTLKSNKTEREYPVLNLIGEDVFLVEGSDEKVEYERVLKEKIDTFLEELGSKMPFVVLYKDIKNEDKKSALVVYKNIIHLESIEKFVEDDLKYEFHKSFPINSYQIYEITYGAKLRPALAPQPKPVTNVKGIEYKEFLAKVANGSLPYERFKELNSEDILPNFSIKEIGNTLEITIDHYTYEDLHAVTTIKVPILDLSPTLDPAFKTEIKDNLTWNTLKYQISRTVRDFITTNSAYTEGRPKFSCVAWNKRSRRNMILIYDEASMNLLNALRKYFEINFINAYLSNYTISDDNIISKIFAKV